jgi:hypothetical protein
LGIDRRAVAVAFLVCALSAGMLAACTGSPDVILTTTPSSGPTPSSSPTLTDKQRRCVSEAAKLLDVARVVEGLVQQAGMSTVDKSILPDVLSTAEAQLASLQALAVHAPFGTPKSTLVHGIQDVVTGYQAIQAGEGTVGPGQASRALVTSGLNEVIAAQTDVEVKQASCAG